MLQIHAHNHCPIQILIRYLTADIKVIFIKDSFIDAWLIQYVVLQNLATIYYVVVFKVVFKDKEYYQCKMSNFVSNIIFRFWLFKKDKNAIISSSWRYVLYCEQKGNAENPTQFITHKSLSICKQISLCQSKQFIIGVISNNYFVGLSVCVFVSLCIYTKFGYISVVSQPNRLVLIINL
jgi:hypothetical protein